MPREKDCWHAPGERLLARPGRKAAGTPREKGCWHAPGEGLLACTGNTDAELLLSFENGMNKDWTPSGDLPRAKEFPDFLPLDAQFRFLQIRAANRFPGFFFKKVSFPEVFFFLRVFPECSYLPRASRRIPDHPAVQSAGKSASGRQIPAIPQFSLPGRQQRAD